jgi:hypothetical protein
MQTSTETGGLGILLYLGAYIVVDTTAGEGSTYHQEAALRGVIDLSPIHNGDHWQPTYGQYDLSGVLRRLDVISDQASVQFGDDPEFHRAMDTTDRFVRESFKLFGGEISPEDPGTFGFVVPTRIDREHWDYAGEVEPLMPVLGYVDVATRQRVLAGMCPFVVDRYGKGPDGRGYMICAPIFSDMITDVEDPAEQLSIIDKVINDTASFAKEKIGISVIGLGAILPRLTDMGNMIKVPALHTTTGHGGTLWLIGETLKKANDMGLIRGGLGKIGVIGAGAIGSSTAELLLAQYPGLDLTISDNKPHRLSGVLADLSGKYPDANIRGTLDNAELLTASPAVVSAITSRLDLHSEALRGVDLDGKFIIDDSQPGCFNPEDLEARGAVLAWPIGHDGTASGLLTREWFDYRGTGPATRSDVWGCEAEGAAIALTRRYNSSINSLVTPEQAQEIGRLCALVGVTVADLQRMGHVI